ncbi:MAG: type II toxin-antitoxin system RelE/ParE family toxin [Syntrophobacteraceae bacterium]
MTITILEYLDERGVSAFDQWFEELNAAAAAKVAASLYRVEQGNLSRVKGVGGGIFEYKIDFGPGYRIYFGKDGEELIILLGGGSKKRQAADIEAALSRWKDYKRRKRQEVTQ